MQCNQSNVKARGVPMSKYPILATINKDGSPMFTVPPTTR